MGNASLPWATPSRWCARLARISDLSGSRTSSLTVTAGFTGLFMVASPVYADKPLGISIEANITTDDNVTRGYGDGNVLADTFLGANLSKSFIYPVSIHTRGVLLGFAGFNGYFEYTGLSHYYAGAQGEFQYRTSGSFYAPTFVVAARYAAEEYQSEARDSYRGSVWVSVRKPITNKLQLFGALNYNWRDGKSVVFDTSDVALRVNTDFAISRRNTVYLGLEYHDGDIVSTGRPSLAYVDIAAAIVPDDAFNDTARYAYKIDGNTWLLNLGYNFAISAQQAFDASWRMVNATPAGVSGASYAAGRIHYTVNQFSLAYMVRF